MINKSIKVPDNVQRDAIEFLKKHGTRGKRSISGYQYGPQRAYNNGYKSGYYSSSSNTPVVDYASDELFNALGRVFDSKGKSHTPFEVGFLTKKDNKVLIKCQAPRYKTQLPSSADGLNPDLLARILHERKDPMPVKRSRFYDMFN